MKQARKPLVHHISPLPDLANLSQDRALLTHAPQQVLPQIPLATAGHVPMAHCKVGLESKQLAPSRLGAVLAGIKGGGTVGSPTSSTCPHEASLTVTPAPEMGFTLLD